MLEIPSFLAFIAAAALVSSARYSKGENTIGGRYCCVAVSAVVIVVGVVPAVVVVLCVIAKASVVAVIAVVVGVPPTLERAKVLL